MKKLNVLKVFETASKFAEKNSPTILAGVAIVGVIGTAYAAYKAGPKAEKIMEKYRKDMKDCDPRDKEAKRAVLSETTRELLPVIIGPTLMGAATIASIIGSQSISKRRIAALSAVCTMSQSKIESLNESLVKVLGERKAQEVKDAVVKDQFKKNDDGNTGKKVDAIFVGCGEVPCKDRFSGRVFAGNVEKIRQARLELSENMIQEMYVSLNDFYDLIGLERIPDGDDFGWNVDECGSGYRLVLVHYC